MNGKMSTFDLTFKIDGENMKMRYSERLLDWMFGPTPKGVDILLIGDLLEINKAKPKG